MSATTLARAVVDALIGAGVRNVVLAPGSRNAPLSFALFDAAAAGALTLHTRIDERTAGFLALGMAKAGHAPVAVVTTSGTAAANLHPAMLEAAHSAVPLIAVTADRPARLRGTLANQTTDQPRLYGAAAASFDLDDTATAIEIEAAVATPGPVQLNVQLDEPLLPADAYVPPEPPARGTRPPRAEAFVIEPGPRTVVVAGDDAGSTARVLAQMGGWPLLAEPSSGSRNGANPIRTYRLLLDTPLADRIERVVVMGAPTLSRPVQRLLARDDVEVLAQRMPGRWRERPHPVTTEFTGTPETPDPDAYAWLEEWQDADSELSGRLDELVDGQPEVSPYSVAAVVNAAVPRGGMLFIGASSPIRDLDLMARPYPVGERRLVLANRGLAGIDGTLSSAIGAAIAREHSTRNLAYVGDVTFLHDMTALVIGPGEQVPDLTIVVVNDDGGSIFSTLEQGAPEHGDAFEKLFGTPHGVDIASLCAATRTPHWRVESTAELAHALDNPAGGIEVVEVVVRRDNRRELDEQVKELARPRTEGS